MNIGSLILRRLKLVVFRFLSIKLFYTYTRRFRSATEATDTGFGLLVDLPKSVN